MPHVDALAQRIRETYFNDLSLEAHSRAFVADLDRRLTHIYEEGVREHFRAPPWDVPGVLLAICCYLAWGEVRSVDSFTRQAVELGFERPRLRLLLSKQIYEEMVHHQMFREAAFAIGKVDPLDVPQPAAIMNMFDVYDQPGGARDVLEKIFYSQFCSERAVIPSFKRIKESMQESKKGLHPLLEKVFARVAHDEPGHVGVGRIAAWELAERGRTQREQMVALAVDSVATTLNVWITEAKNIPAIVSFAGSLVAAKIRSTVQPHVREEFNWEIASD